MSNNRLTITHIGQILSPIFAQNAVVRVSVFGSYARGDETPDSDIDFLVEFAEGASLLNLGCLHEDISDAIGFPADILTPHSLMKEPKKFSENILRDARVIYEKK